MTTPTSSHEAITVLGPIAPEQMGITQTHEHLFIDAMDHYSSYEFVIDDEDVVAQELTEFTTLGGKTICDVTTDEIGRNPEGLVRMSRRTGIHVVMGSGFYRDFGYPRIVQELTSRELAGGGAADSSRWPLVLTEHRVRGIRIGIKRGFGCPGCKLVR